MKTLKLLQTLLVPLFAIALSTAAMSLTLNYKEKAKNTIESEITKMLNRLDTRQLKTPEEEVQIKFTVNDQNEVVVLTTDNLELDEKIKNTLNYQPIEVNDIRKNRLYSVQVTLSLPGA